MIHACGRTIAATGFTVLLLAASWLAAFMSWAIGRAPNRDIPSAAVRQIRPPEQEEQPLLELDR